MIFIDPPRNHPKTPRGMNPWCHIWSSTNDLEELRAFADRMGLKRSWYQRRPGFPHYDVTGKNIALAIKMGAHQKSLKQWLQKRGME